MTVLRRLALLGLLLIAAMPQSRAQVALNGSTALELYGLKFTPSNCTFNGVACGSNWNLVGVQAGRGNIEYEVVSSAGSGSAALSRDPNSAGSGNDILSFKITVASVTGQPTTLVTSAALIDSGIRTYSCNGSCSSGTSATAKLDTFVGVTFAPTTVSQALTLNQAALQTPTSSKITTAGDNGFTYIETLTLSTLGTTSYHSTPDAILQLNNVATLFRAAPEPASMAVLAVAFGGLAVVRRRRGASTGGTNR